MCWTSLQPKQIENIVEIVPFGKTSNSRYMIRIMDPTAMEIRLYSYEALVAIIRRADKEVEIRLPAPRYLILALEMQADSIWRTGKVAQVIFQKKDNQIRE